MVEILGALLGGAFRLVPELIKFLGEKADRKHELALIDKQIALDTLRGKQELALQDGQMELAQIQGQLANLGTALRGQFTKTGIRLVDAMTWSVRPLTTYILLLLYVAAKVAGLVMAIQSGDAWATAILQMYDDQDRALLSGILAFWFVSRTLDKASNGRP